MNAVGFLIYCVGSALFFVAGAAWQRCRDLDRQLKEVDR